ncbi:MAG: copper chaperone PCu(A)C [Idiomarina sp.]|nr:copper chaperone PCu(A)C [Idiomarina sp.]
MTSSDLWLRESVPGAENGAGFGTLHNPTDQDVVVIAAASSAAVDVELHQHVHRDGQMSMEHIAALTIPAGESVELKPGGYHIMLMQLHEPLQTDDTHSLSLRLDTGERIEFSVKVRSLLQ